MATDTEVLTAQQRIEKAKRTLVLLNYTNPVDPTVLASSIDALANVLIRAKLATIEELQQLQLEAQAALLEGFVTAAQGMTRARSGFDH